MVKMFWNVRVVIAVLFFCLMFDAGVTFGADANEQRFVQDRFAIGFWVDPPADEKMEERYAEIAEANFTLVIGGFGAKKAEEIEEQIALCEKYGLVCIVGRGSKFDAEQLAEGDGVWGYSVRDEPGTADFAGLRESVDAIRKARPGRLAYINLFPGYAPAEILGAENYDEYVRRFVEEVGVDVLSMDHYPAMKPDADGRRGYCKDLEVMRKYSLEKDIPFWNFFNVMPFGPHFDPTEAQIRWQIYTSLAYGAKGVLYFCYWTPGGGEFPKGGAIIRQDGSRTRHYDQAKRINLELKNLGPTLMELTSKEVIRIEPGERGLKALRGGPVRSLSGGDYLIGVFEHSDGRRAVQINNYEFAYTGWATVEFDAEAGEVVEVDPQSGKEIAVYDDSPLMEGLQLSLDAGMGRLFLMPKGSEK